MAWFGAWVYRYTQGSSMHPTQSTQFEHAALKNYLLDHAYDEMFSGRAICIGTVSRCWSTFLRCRRRSCNDESRRRISAF